jgi:hypothetical protein
MMKKYAYLLSVAAMAAMFYGCNKVPQAEMDAAKAALEKAKTAQADVYLENELLAIQDSLNATLVDIETQRSKVFGDFKKAKANLGKISFEAEELVKNTENRKEQIKNEIAQAQTATLSLLEESNLLLADAPKGKEGKLVPETIKNDLNAIRISVSEIPGLVEKGDLLVAQTRINAAQQKATDINSELKTVLEKYSKRS